MPDNVLGDVFEELKDTASNAASQANPLKILETGVQQVTGQNQGQGIDEANQMKQFKKQIKSMKVSDQSNSQAQMAQIRQNLAQLMQPPPPPKDELPKYVSGQAGFSVEKIKKQQEEIEKQKKGPSLLDRFRNRNAGANEGHRGAAG